MRAFLEIPEKEFHFEFDNFSFNQYRIIGNKPHDEIPMINIKFPSGELITIVTSNMPDELKKAIDEMIKQYCGH